MKYPVRSWAILVIFLVCVGHYVMGQSPPADESGLLVLRNGEVFAGRVTWAGDSYSVQTPGRQLTFAKGNVLLVARNMADAYQQRQAALRPTDWQGRQELAAWCIKHEMLDEAVRELDVAEETSPGHATTIRLRGAVEILRQRRAAIAANPPAPTPPTTRRDDALDRLVETLPEGAVGTFTKSIQPLLVNGCAAAACHGQASTAAYRLVRIDTRQAASRYATLRNLDATLKLIDREQPDRSPLLTVPRGPHATAKSAVFGPRNAAQYDQLAAWVRGVAGNSDNSSDTQSASSPPKTSTAAGGPKKASPRQRRGTEPKSPAANHEQKSSDQPPAVDPFDPAGFNNRRPSAP